jgi:hypothetical protein
MLRGEQRSPMLGQPSGQLHWERDRSAFPRLGRVPHNCSHVGPPHAQDAGAPAIGKAFAPSRNDAASSAYRPTHRLRIAIHR